MRLFSVVAWLSAIIVLYVAEPGSAPCQGAEPRFAVHTDFEGGSARVLEVDADTNRVRITPGGQPERGWACWWAMRIENLALQQPLTVEVSPSPLPTRHKGQLSQKPLAAGWSSPARASISYDGTSWQLTEPGIKAGDTIRYRVVPQQATLWIAWGPLFTPKNTAELVARAAAKIPGARSFELARTRQGRAVTGLLVGPSPAAEKSRPGIWIQARQHAWETGASWVARGLVEWLIEQSPPARWLTEHCETVIVPVMDVDNVATGNGGKEQDPRDHNRDWDDAPVYPEVAAAQKRLKEWAAEGRADFFIDLHNPAPGDKRPFFFCGPADLLSERARTGRELFLELATRHINGPLPVEATPRITGPSYHPLWRKISGQWVTDHGNEHTVAVCLETSWNTPASTTDGYLTVGRQLGETISDYIQRRLSQQP